MWKRNVWIKKNEQGAIDPDEVALGDDEANVEGDDYEEKGNETDAIIGALSPTTFDIRNAFKAILGRFNNLNSWLDSMEHK